MSINNRWADFVAYVQGIDSQSTAGWDEEDYNWYFQVREAAVNRIASELYQAQFPDGSETPQFPWQQAAPTEEAFQEWFDSIYAWEGDEVPVYPV